MLQKIFWEKETVAVIFVTGSKKYMVKAKSRNENNKNSGFIVIYIICIRCAL